ncbi:hypothetical protein BpHYR1_025982 [Brachionus plicatilis]|uniref:OTU domain-containing protein n=1 Tax=Brachionus plicatilis TaxID=10195 RepID=A0A3M7QQT4_BRAPC|nr:hypothetical protein BpHYR1_025982 [Brachionus plicatilis]
MVPVCSKKDGNCLYNSFAILYFGVEDLFYLFKLISFYVFFEYEAFFRMIFNDMANDETFEVFVQKMTKRGEWANHFNIISLSIFLKKKIYIYSLDSSKNIIYNTKIDMWDNSDPPLTIGFLNNHFVPFISTGYQEFEDIENDVFMRQRKIFLEIVN